MLLNHQKPSRASSTLSGHHANFSVDKDLQTCWSARSAGADEWLESDLGADGGGAGGVRPRVYRLPSF